LELDLNEFESETGLELDLIGFERNGIGIGFECRITLGQKVQC